MRYPIAIHKDADSDYGVTVPDLPGCFSAGETFEEAMDNAVEAILCHAEGIVDEGELLPPLLGIASHQANPDYAGAVWAFVDVDLTRVAKETVRINVTAKKSLLDAIDRAAAAAHSSRSRYLVESAYERACAEAHQ